MNEEKMDTYYSVFNEHVNDAGKRTKKIMKKLTPKYLKRIQEIEKEHGGIMGIFHEDIEPATAMYASLVTYFVNEDD